MRFVQKDNSPDFFETCKKQLPLNPKWKDFDGNKEMGACKKALHEHLVGEQLALCIYCERKISKTDSHIEHIYPKNEKTGSPERTFDYANLVASCNGDLCESGDSSIYQPEDVHSCGHKKGDGFEELHFLNPVQRSDIGTFFTYHKETGAMLAANDNTTARYTIDLLNLDCTRLRNERISAARALFSQMNKSNNTAFQQLKKSEKIRRLLNHNPAFVSFLTFYFSIA